MLNDTRCLGSYITIYSLCSIVRPDYSRVATLLKLRSGTRVSCSDPSSDSSRSFSCGRCFFTSNQPVDCNFTVQCTPHAFSPVSIFVTAISSLYNADLNDGSTLSCDEKISQ